MSRPARKLGAVKMTEQYDEALVYARELHRDQLRKGSGVAYVAHLLSVSAAVLEMRGDEDQAIAGLLHDSVEDVGEHVLAMIETRFGPDRGTRSSTPARTDHPDKPTWQDRKVVYLAVGGCGRRRPVALRAISGSCSPTSSTTPGRSGPTS